MEKYILALDQGTTSCRALLVDHNGKVIASAQKEFPQYFPKPGWVEHNPMEIWQTQKEVVHKAIEKSEIEASAIQGIGITNQRETVVVWDKNTGEPIYNAIVWQDRRTASFCDQLMAAGKSEMVRLKTGLVIDAYFSGTKVNWILDQVEGARKRAENGELIMGTIDCWLIWNMTQGDLHITDVTNACRTLVYNINTLEWDEELLQMLNIPSTMLPEVKSSSEIYGDTHRDFIGASIPIAGIAGDQQAALFGQMCTRKGMVKNTYGTGCFLLMNIGDQPIVSKNNLLTSIAWQLDGKVTYALEGSIFIAGAVVQWLRDSLKVIDESAEIEALASSVDDSEGIYFVPAFAGLGAPHWNPYARGAILGLTRGSSDAHIARAALESIAFQTRDVLKAMEADTGIPIAELRVDGGATVNNVLMQFQSEVLNTKTIRPKNVETTVMGAAFLAGLAVGFWDNLATIEKIWETDRQYVPSEDREKITKKIEGWNQAVNAVIAYTKTEK